MRFELFRQFCRRPDNKAVPAAIFAAFVLVAGDLPASEPVALRVESFTVAPSSQPLARVVVKNLLDQPCEAIVSLQGAPGWKITPVEQPVSLAANQTQKVAFDIGQGVSVEANQYPIVASATVGDTVVTRQQAIVCASAPYFKPTIDGDPADWADAIPVTFTTAGRKTVVRTFWNSRTFSLLVAVDEDRLVPLSEDSATGPVDAVQLAISPGGSTTGTLPDDEVQRYEFLAVATSASRGGRCFRLASPGMRLAETQQPGPLMPRLDEDAQVAVRRDGQTTYYEIGLAMRPMRKKIRPGEGREFCLSIIVHDPDGTGPRDWGEAAGLFPSERNWLAWSRWQGDNWGQSVPLDNKTPWGMCSSKY